MISVVSGGSPSANVDAKLRSDLSVKVGKLRITHCDGSSGNTGFSVVLLMTIIYYYERIWF
jgi:hypothetical protein